MVGALLSACGSGSVTNSNSVPNPRPVGSYQGIPYNQLGNPPGLINYPEAYFPTFTDTTKPDQAKIAYGRNDQVQISNLAANVRISNTYICSATPVYYNAQLNSTFLIGAAHCFVSNKNQQASLNSTNLVARQDILISYGLGGNYGWQHTYPVQAIYIMPNYCYGSTFNDFNACPNFSPNSVAGGQGNDLAVIQISGIYADPESYPQVVPAAEYPEPATQAPVFSLGYGLNTQTPTSEDSSLSRNSLFYVANYFYAYSEFPFETGYNYLYNSYYNQGELGQTGFSELICGGDSGGGDLFWTGSKWILLAEHTYGPAHSCGQFFTNYPNGATNISSYYAWIESIIKDQSQAGPVADCQNGNIPNCVTNGG